MGRKVRKKILSPRIEPGKRTVLCTIQVVIQEDGTMILELVEK